MKAFFVIETPEQLKVISEPLRIRLVTMLVAKEATGKQLSQELQLSASKIHYHLRELETQGLVTVARTEEKNGIIQKFYRAVAIDYVLSEKLLPSGQPHPFMVQEIIASQLRMALSQVYATEEELFQSESKIDDAETVLRPLMHGIWEVRAKRTDLLKWQQKFRKVMLELSELDRTATEADDDTELFFMTAVGFPTNVETLQVDERELPVGYQINRDPISGEKVAREVEDNNDDNRS